MSHSSALVYVISLNWNHCDDTLDFLASATIGGVDSPNERYHMALSSVLFFRKHVRSWRWLIVGPYRTGSAIKTVMRLLTARRSRAAWAYLRGLYDGLRR